MALFFLIGNGGELNQILLQPDKVIPFIYTTDNDLRMIFSLAPVAILLTILYLFRSSIFLPKFEDASDFGLHGTSKWGKPSDVINGKAFSIRNVFNKNPLDAFQMEKGIILSKIPNKRELLIMPRDTSIDNRNVLVIGSSGSGKGQAFVFPNVLNHSEETIIITDPKGEIYEATHQIKRDEGYRLYKVDFTNFKDCDRYNPLDYVRNDEDARSVADTIASNSVENGKRDFWTESAVSFLSAFILFVKVEHKEKANMSHVVKLVSRAGKEEDFIDELLEDLSPEHPAYDLFSLANMSTGNTRSGIMSTLAQQISIFSMQKIASMTQTSDFNFRDLQKEKSILYIKIRMESNPFIQLTATFFEQLLSVLYDVADENHSKLPISTIFLLDEFPNIGKINKYPRVLATCRGLGMAMMTIVQDLGQLEDKKLYGPETARSIINNHDTSLFLRTKDTKTAKYFSEIAGETTVKHKQKSTSFGKRDGSRSISEQYVKRPLITQGELMNMDPKGCYLFVSGMFPMKLEKSFQFHIYGDLLFKDRKPNYSSYRNQFLHFYGQSFLNEKGEKQTGFDNDEDQYGYKEDAFDDDFVITDVDETIEKEQILTVEELELLESELEVVLAGEIQVAVASNQMVEKKENPEGTREEDQELLLSLKELENELNELEDTEVEVDEEALISIINDWSKD